MKSNKKAMFIGLVMFLAAVLTINLLTKDVWDVNEEHLREEIMALDDSVETIDLLEVTPFEWDVVYSFDPYTTKEKVYQTVGYKWDNINGTVSEGMNQIVFMKDEKVVCYLYGYPENNDYGIYLTGQVSNEVSQVLRSTDNLDFQIKRNDDIVYLTN